MTVKLEGTDRDRLKSLAVAKRRTSHFLMKEAITAYLAKEEAEERFVTAALEARKHYRETGLHITHEELNNWVDGLAKDPSIKSPVCHI